MTMTTSTETHGNGTIAHARSVAASVVHHGTFAPITSTMRAYSVKATVASSSATTSRAAA